MRFMSRNVPPRRERNKRGTAGRIVPIGEQSTKGHLWTDHDLARLPIAVRRVSIAHPSGPKARRLRNVRVTDSCGPQASQPRGIRASRGPASRLELAPSFAELQPSNQTVFHRHLPNFKCTSSPQHAPCARSPRARSPGISGLLRNTHDSSRAPGVDKLVDKKVIEGRSFFLNDPTPWGINGSSSSRHIGPRTLGRRSRLGAATGIGASGAISSRRRSSRSSFPARLGRQFQACSRGVAKASVLSNHLRVEPSRIAGDRTVTLAMPNQSTLPSLGKKCGRRERESRREDVRERSLAYLARRGG